MDWTHGYFADTGYTFGFYPELCPTRLRMAALIHGSAVPEMGFRYLDAGCGQGLNALFAAAFHPESEFIGIDFHPEHVAHARALGREAGLSNVSFIEGDFMELVEVGSGLGQFDYITCHGVSTWISLPVRDALFQFVGRALKPGGLFYNSYNTFPGWLATAPFQHLVLLAQRSSPGLGALSAAKQVMANLKALGSPMFDALPALPARLQAIEGQSQDYVHQEYGNQHWRPVFVSEMLEALQRVKLTYIGSANLPEAFESLIAPALQTLLDDERDRIVREQLRDFALNQSFRRDLYVKGRQRLWPNDPMHHLRDARFIRNPTLARPEKGEFFLFSAGGFDLKGEPKYYGALLDHLEIRQEGSSLDEIIAAGVYGAQRDSLLQAVALLLHAGYILERREVSEATKVAVKALNVALSRASALGAPYRHVALAEGATALQVTELELSLLNYYFENIQ